MKNQSYATGEFTMKSPIIAPSADPRPQPKSSLELRGLTTPHRLEKNADESHGKNTSSNTASRCHFLRPKPFTIRDIVKVDFAQT